MRIGRKRLLVGASVLAGLGGAAALVAGTTFGFFSSTAPGETNNFAAGTVSLTSTATGACTVKTIVPGTSGTCTFTTTYTGSVQAFEGLNTSTTGTLATYLTITIKTTGGHTYANTATNLYVGTVTTGAARTFTVSWSLPIATTTGQGDTASVSLTAHAVQKKFNGDATGCTAGVACVTITNWS